MSNHPKTVPHPTLWYRPLQRNLRAGNASPQDSVYDNGAQSEMLPYPALSKYAIIALHLPAWLVLVYLYFQLH